MYLYSSKGFGGVVRNVSLEVTNLDTTAFNIIVVSLAKEEDKDSDIKITNNINIKSFRINEIQKLDFNAMSKIKTLLERYKIDILSCQGYKPDVYGFFLRKIYKCNIKLVTTKHGWGVPGFKMQVYCFLDKLTARWFDKVILVSEGLRDKIVNFGFPENKIVIIKNAIGPVNVNHDKNHDLIRKKFYLSKTDYVVGIVGRLSKEKDIKTALFAVAEVMQLDESVRVLLAGEGPEKAKLKKIAEKLKIANKVIFLGYQQNIDKVYDAIDLYISSSISEGLPNSILEAQIRGIPCVVTNIRGNNDIIKDGKNGFLVNTKNHRELSAKILILLKNKQLARTFVENGKQIVKEKFSLTNKMQKLENLYRGLMTKSK